MSPLTGKDLDLDQTESSNGGLIIAGSCSPKTISQLEVLRKGRGENLAIITMTVKDLIANEKSSEKAIEKVADEANSLICDGKDVLLMTSREALVGSDERASLKIGAVVAAALVQFLRLINPRPRYIIAKGSITSSDAAMRSLRMRRPEIVGQAASGVPIWRCHERTSRFPGIPFVLFPGNVGDDDILLGLVSSWASHPTLSASPTPMQYQRLGKSGLKISKIILGCMSFGNPKWEGSPWILAEEKALPLLKKAYDLGINTWDTANTYSNGLSESIIGKALETYSIPREKIIIMTKLYYPVLEDTPNSRPNPALNDGALVNQTGLSRKHIIAAVEASLRRLRTTYIDILQLHRLDDTCPEEIMGTLHDLVTQGKIHYLGASTMRCWQLARLQYTAKLHSWTTFTSMQGLYNLLYREEEREMNQFCHAEGIGLIPWSPLARGLLCRPSNEATQRSVQDKKTVKWFEGTQNEAIISRVEVLARRKRCSMTDISIAWLLKKGCCPIVGLNSVERIESVSRALNVRLGEDECEMLEELYLPLRPQAM